jgi:hypothetical protein
VGRRVGLDQNNAMQAGQTDRDEERGARKRGQTHRENSCKSRVVKIKERGHTQHTQIITRFGSLPRKVKIP